MLLAMHDRLTATVLSAPDVSTAASRWAMASKVHGAGRSDRPISCPSAAAIRSANSGCVLMPVPRAVPPMASSESDAKHCSSRRMPCSTWLA